MIVKEWKCMAHGYFEAAVPDDTVARCPRGCDSVERAFLSPASISTSGKTRFVDKTMEDLAKRFGMTNMSNANGDSVIHNQAKDAQRNLAKNDLAPIWKAMPKNGNVAQVLKESGVSTDSSVGLVPQQFVRPHAVVADGMKHGDASMLKGALAEGQKNQGQA